MRRRIPGRHGGWRLLLALGLSLLPALAGCGGTAKTAATSATRSRARTVRTHPVSAPATTARTATTTAPPTRPRPHADLAELIGQMIVARFRGPTPSAAFLTRVRAGQVGGVILSSDNVAGGATATRRLT